MPSSCSELAVRSGRPTEREACISIWVQACANRDGCKIDGIAEDAGGKFDHGVTWLVAEDTHGLAGFVLCTEPGSELPTDPQDAAVVSLLAVAPDHQGLGAGRDLLERALADLRKQGHHQAVLHVFADNAGAVALYERTGWRRIGDAIMIDPLGRRPSWTYSYSLARRQPA